MGFQVGFVPDVQAEFVADIVEARVIGVVAGAYGVEVVALHHQGIFQHIFVGHSFAVFLVVIVAVGPFDVNHLAVDQQFAVFDFHFAETDAVRVELHGFASRIFEGYH